MLLACHQKVMDRDKKESGALLIMPTSDMVMSAMQIKPEEATEEQKQAMDILLNMAVPSVVPNVLKSKTWIAEQTTHSDFIGETWPIDFGSALLLLECFSETHRIYENAGYWDKEGNPIPEDQRTGVPEKKNRTKDMTKKNQKQIIETHSRLCVEVKEMFGAVGAKERMDAWDMLCCSKRGKKQSNGNVVSTVPPPLAQPEAPPVINHTDLLLQNSGLLRVVDGLEDVTQQVGI